MERNLANSPVEGTVVYPKSHYLQRFSTSKTVVGNVISGCHQRYGISSSSAVAASGFGGFSPSSPSSYWTANRRASGFDEILELGKFFGQINVTRVIVKGGGYN